MMKQLALAGALAIATATSAVADRAPLREWTTIGSKEVGRGLDKDSISVPGKRRYGEVRLCVVQRPIRIFDFTVRFANDEYQKLQVRNTLKPNQCTRSIDLYGKRRNVERVWLTYERIRNRGTPVIYVQAR
jgi:hypothetical protein